MSQTTAAPRQTYAPSGSAAQRRIKAKTVGSFVPGLTKKACEKYGFSAASLISDWPQIVGRDLSRHTSPQRLKWPRYVPAYQDVETGCEGRPGATLILHVDPAKALDIQYGTTQLIERINGYFGYRAVSDIRIVQAPIKPADSSAHGPVPALGNGKTADPQLFPPLAGQKSSTATSARSPNETIEVANISNDRLRSALERLAKSLK